MGSGESSCPLAAIGAGGTTSQFAVLIRDAGWCLLPGVCGRRFVSLPVARERTRVRGAGRGTVRRLGSSSGGGVRAAAAVGVVAV